MNEPDELLERACAGDAEALAQVWQRHRGRLERMVQLRLDHRLQGRLDASDVLQEAFLEVARTIRNYTQAAEVSFFLWLRHLTGRRLQTLHRYHLGTQQRDAGRDVSLSLAAIPEASSATLADQLAGPLTTPGEAAVQAEMRRRIRDALDKMEPLDREILALRHYEQLNNGEAAQVLNLGKTAASNRYVRALERLKTLLADLAGSDVDAPVENFRES